jgi:hexulose-6-phosphate isomerase
MKLGIMQGRLVPPEAGRFQSFPRSRWRDEFEIAAAAGLDTIEWIFDAYGEDINPLCTDAGLDEMQALCRRHEIRVESVCADWFMDFPLVEADAVESRRRWQKLEWLMQRCAMLNIGRVVIPFVDASAIRSDEHLTGVVAGINALGAIMDRTHVELHLETALPPSAFVQILSQTTHPGVKVNYDSGNSASLGFEPRAEFAAYGSRVGSVHLKDRVLGAGTVPLGHGDTDFQCIFECLAEVGYRGDFILQVARGVAGDELAWARQNVAAARDMLRKLAKP